MPGVEAGSEGIVLNGFVTPNQRYARLALNAVGSQLLAEPSQEVLPVGPVRLFVLLAFVEAGDTVGEIYHLGSGNGPPLREASAL